MKVRGNREGGVMRGVSIPDWGRIGRVGNSHGLKSHEEQEKSK